MLEAFAMNPYLLLILGQLMLGLAHFSHKLFSRKSDSFLPTGALYSALISAFSLPIFFLLSGFDLSLDAGLAFYSVAYGVLASVSQVMIFIAFSRVNMVVYSVFCKSASILVCLCGFIFFGDKVTFNSVLSILLLTVAIALPLLEARKNGGKSNSLVSLIICLIIMVDGFLIQLTVKGFTELESTTTERASALYFYANVITAIVLFAVLFFIVRKGKTNKEKASEFRIGFRATARKVPFKFYILIPLTATIANIPCVTNAYCMMNMDLNTYIIVLNAAESLVLFLISRFIFKEKSTILDIMALILSTLAGIIVSF